MPVSYTILDQHGLVLVTYKGSLRAEETLETFERYARDPGYSPGQKQLVDLSRITTVESDFPQLMAMQARKADIFLEGAAQTILVYLAPPGPGQRLASQIARSWEPFHGVVVRIVETEAEALEILGLPASRIDDLLPAPHPQRARQ